MELSKLYRYNSVIISIFLFLMFFSLLMITVPHILSKSADAVHHYILVDYIANNGYPIEKTISSTSYLREMVEYPPLPCMIAAFFLKFSSGIIFPFDAMNLVLLIVISIIPVFIYLISFEMTSQLWASLISISFLLVNVYYYEQFLGSYFFSMIFGELFILISLYSLIRFEISKQKFWILVFSLNSLLLIFSYTSWFLIPVLSFFILVYFYHNYFNKLDLVYIIPILIIFVIFSYLRRDTGFSILKHEGLAVVVTLKTLIFFLPLFVIFLFMAVGIIFYIQEQKRIISPLLYISIIFMNAILFLIANFAVYHLIKLIYLLSILGTIFAGYGFIRVWEKSRIKKNKNIMFLCLFLISYIAMAGYLVYYSTQVSPPFTISDYQLSEMVLKDDAVNQSLLNIELDTGIENYWVSLGFLHMDPVRSNEFLNMRSIDYGEEYFIFTNAGKNNETTYLQVGDRSIVKKVEK